MKLMLSLPSPFARKVRAVAAERGIALELVEVDVFQADNGVAEANPLRKVPCLVTDDGEAWYDSRVIVELLDGLGDGPRLIPDDRAERLAARRIEALADGLLDAAVLVRMERLWPGRTPEQRSAAWQDWQWAKVDGAFAELERRLGGRAHFVGGRVTLADLAVASALGWLDYRLPDHPWRPLAPGLAAWYATFATRPAFASTAPPPLPPG
ncbi:MAG: glutathione S-transferase C-terminal domain-containing protein [Lysobacteraceae bacterium]|jgi:glutathione S-transferase